MHTLYIDHFKMSELEDNELELQDELKEQFKKIKASKHKSTLLEWARSVEADPIQEEEESLTLSSMRW